MQLVNVKETYEVVFPEENVEKGKEPVFVLRKLSAGEANSIDDEITVSKGDMSFAYLGGTASRMKIDLALVSWRNVGLEEGKDAPCTSATKELLPSLVQQFLVRRIDDDNGLSKTKKRGEDEKN